MTDPTPQTIPTRDEATELARLVNVHRNEIGHYTGFDFVHRLERHFAALASAPAPASGGVDAVAHEANEWADLASTGFQWLKNIRDGISTVDEALSNMDEGLANCMSASDKARFASLSPAATQGDGTVTITTNGSTRVIPADEPVFLIRGQDVIGGAAVRAWATLAEASGADFDMCQIAREHAAKMDAWPKKKVADLPEQEDGR